MKTKDLNKLLDFHEFKFEADKLIIEKLLLAHKNWGIRTTNINDFFETLKLETKGELNKENLKNISKNYIHLEKTNIEWKSKSIDYLIEIFDSTGFSNLSLLLESISKRFQVIVDSIEIISVFEKQGYPSIKFYENHFEIKAIDFWEYRSFKYSNIDKISIYSLRYKIFGLFTYNHFTPERKVLQEIKILMKNGSYFKYKTSSVFNQEFEQSLKTIKRKITIASTDYN